MALSAGRRRSKGVWNPSSILLIASDALYFCDRDSAVLQERTASLRRCGAIGDVGRGGSGCFGNRAQKSIDAGRMYESRGWISGHFRTHVLAGAFVKCVLSCYETLHVVGRKYTNIHNIRGPYMSPVCLFMCGARTVNVVAARGGLVRPFSAKCVNRGLAMPPPTAFLGV